MVGNHISNLKVRVKCKILEDMETIWSGLFRKLEMIPKGQTSNIFLLSQCWGSNPELYKCWESALPPSYLPRSQKPKLKNKTDNLDSFKIKNTFVVEAEEMVQWIKGLCFSWGPRFDTQHPQQEADSHV